MNAAKKLEHADRRWGAGFLEDGFIAAVDVATKDVPPGEMLDLLERELSL